MLWLGVLLTGLDNEEIEMENSKPIVLGETHDVPESGKKNPYIYIEIYSGKNIDIKSNCDDMLSFFGMLEATKHIYPAKMAEQKINEMKEKLVVPKGGLFARGGRS